MDRSQQSSNVRAVSARQVFVILVVFSLLLVISELVFYIFSDYHPYFRKPDKSGQATKKEQLEKIVSQSPPLVTEASRNEGFKIQYLDKYVDHLKNVNGLGNFVQGVEIQVTIKGRVEVAVFNPDLPLEQDYVFHITLRDQRFKELKVYLTRQEVRFAKVYLGNTKERQEVTLAGIKPNDIIEIEQTQNLVEPEGLDLYNFYIQRGGGE